jgi:hypothetical protein
VKDRRGRGPAPLLLLASLCVALLAVAGYVYSVFGFYGVSRFTPMVERGRETLRAEDIVAPLPRRRPSLPGLVPAGSAACLPVHC